MHGDARRLAEGFGALVAALAADLPPGSVHLGHVLTQVADAGDHVVLTFAAGNDTIQMQARTVVLALPPRLLLEHVVFTPPLDDATREAMDGSATWMAAQAKVAIATDTASWRAAGLSGNAFVSHEQAVLGEVYDACDATGTQAALGGFVALSPDLRDSFAAGLPMLLDNQMVQLFGAALEAGRSICRIGRTSPSPAAPATAPPPPPPIWTKAIRCCAARCGKAGCIWGARRPPPAAPAIWRARWRPPGASNGRCAATIPRRISPLPPGQRGRPRCGAAGALFRLGGGPERWRSR